MVPKSVVAALLAGCAALWANWGSQASGSVATGGFQAMGASQVEMLEESLVIELYRDRAKVRVDYTFRNTGDAVDVTAGFPCLGLHVDEKDYIEVEDYVLTAGGGPVPYRIRTGNVRNWRRLFTREYLDMVGVTDEPPGADCRECRLWWFVSTVRFEKGETKQVAIRYESRYENSEGGYSDDADFNPDVFRYLLSTASVWKGPIQKGKVVIKAVTIDAAPLMIRPARRFQKTAEGFVWEFTNLRPTLADNIEVNLNNKFSRRWNYIDRVDERRDGFSWYSLEGNRYYFDFHSYTAAASSEKPEYPAQAVRDTDPATAWVAGKSSGETLTLTLTKPQRVDRIGIIPGCAKSKSLYFANNRIREVDVSVNGRRVATAALPDEYISFWPASKKAYQWIDLGRYAGEAKTIALTVRSVYAGTKAGDTCISEVLLRRLVSKSDLPSR